MNSRQAQAAIHIAAVLFGLAGIFGELIQASALLITAGRAAFSTVALLLIVLHAGHRITRPDLPTSAFLILAGALLAAHWTLFFVAVKVGGVAIATLGFASFPAFITLLEGILFKERTHRHEWLAVVLIMIGLILVTPNLDFNDQATTGLAWGVACGLAFALFTPTNRTAVRRLPARQVACYENLVVVLLTLPWCLAEFATLNPLDWLWIALLGMLCTALSHVLLVSGLLQLKASSAGIILALEPVYAIFFAAVLFAQYPSLRTLLGGLIMVGAIVWSGMRTRREPAPNG